MSQLVVQNRRFKYHAHRADAWTVIATYNADTPQQSEVQAWLIDAWRTDKSTLGYARFRLSDGRDFTPAQALHVVGLAKTGHVTLCIDRWGRVSGFKLKGSRAWTARAAQKSS